MDTENYARLSIVVSRRTDTALRAIAHVTDRGLSSVVRELIDEPAAMMAEVLCARLSSSTPEEVQAVEDQVEMFVEQQYGKYLRQRESGHE